MKRERNRERWFWYIIHGLPIIHSKDYERDRETERHGERERETEREREREKEVTQAN